MAPQGLHRFATMAHTILLLRRQLCHGLRKRWIAEDGVVTEPARSPGLARDSSLAGGLVLEDDPPLVRERHGAHVTGGSIRLGDFVEKLENPRVLHRVGSLGSEPP